MSTRFRFVTAGESHGPGLVAIVEGVPAGLALDREALDRDMARRQLGHGRGGRMKIESDTVEVRSGLRHGRTLGSPIALLVANRDYANWEERMNPWPVEGFAPEEVHLPRPGHADLVGAQKYGHGDVRNVLERASARETAARVAAGAVARGLLAALGVSVHSHVTQIGSVRAPERPDLGPEDFAAVDEDPVRCLDPEASAAMVAEIDRLRKANESLGGSFEVRAFGLVPGLGSHVSWEERLDGRLAGAVASIQSVKGVSIGEAWEVAGRPGSQAHDEIFWSEERGYHRETNHAGGLEGGMTNGMPLSVRAAIKPISTLTKPLRSVDTETKQPGEALRERTDSTVVPAAAVVAEAMVCLTLASCYREKFGGDHIDDVARRARRLQAAHRLARLAWPPPSPMAASPAIVFVGFMGAGKSTALEAARAAGLETTEADELMERELGMPIAEAFERDGEEAFRAREAEAVGCPARGRRRLARSRSAAAASSPSGCAPRCSATSSSGSTSMWGGLASGSRSSDRPLAQSRSTSSTRSAAERCRCTRRLPTRCCRSATPGWPRRALPSIRALAELPQGTKMLWAASASGEYPVFVGPRPAGRRRLVAARRPPLLVTDTAVGALYGDRVEPLAARIEVAAGRGREDDGRGRSGCCAELARAGMTREDHVVALGGGVVGDLAGFCAHLYQRGVPRRPGADHARRPGRLRLRRQDRRRPAGGQELRRRLPPAGGGRSPIPSTLATLPREELAAGFVEALKTGLLAGGALWERVRAIESLHPGELD